MRFISRTTISHAMLISSTVPENDYTEWSAATAYNVGDRCIRTTATTHKIYERKVAGTTATAPESDAVNWITVTATNRWKMFDEAVGSITVGASPLTVVLAPGIVRALSLHDIVASSVRVTMTDGAGGPTVYDKTYTMADATPIVDYYDWCFAPIELQSTLIVDDLPPYEDGRITVTLTASGNAQCGTLAVGELVEIGDTQRGVSLGIVDYSRRETDSYGVTTVQVGDYANRMEVPFWIELAHLDYAIKKLASVRGRPCVWIADPRYASQAFLGFYEDFSIDCIYGNHGTGRIFVKGLV